MADFDKNRFDAKTVEWATPIDFFQPLDDEFKFTLDVCATHENKKVTKYFTLAEDGLIQNWNGNVCLLDEPAICMVGQCLSGLRKRNMRQNIKM